MRERGNVWPIISVALGAFLVLFVLPLVIQRQKSGEMATVEAHVSIGETGSDGLPHARSTNYRWPDSKVPRTADRLRDVTAIAIASLTYVVEGAMSGKPPRSAGEILDGIIRRNLIPGEWLTSQAGVLQMPNGTVHLRYSPASLSVEVISVPKDRSDGPALLIRIPDAENSTVGPRYFESMQLDGILYPSPFAPLPAVISAGWQQRHFKQTQLPDAERAQLEQWSKSSTRK
ncbi:MAG: hypothetical protein ACREBG_23695 [Pyrinomonadaceae bacterium]